MGVTFCFSNASATLVSSSAMALTKSPRWWNSQATVSPEYYPVVITGSLLAVLPLILAFILLQRFWRSGLTAGAVK